MGIKKVIKNFFKEDTEVKIEINEFNNLGVLFG